MTAGEWLWTHTWWRFDPSADPWHAVPYHCFNLVEGLIWLVEAILVYARFRRHRYSVIECGYAVAFVTFALTDFREAFVLQSWLIWLKLINLIALLLLRRHVMKRFYPQSRVF